MKGIAPLLLAVLGFAAIGSGLVLSAIVSPAGNQSAAQNASGPVEIGTNAATHLPWGDLWDYFFSGLVGIIRWLSNYLILPLVNWGGSIAAGHAMVFPEYLGWAIVALMLLVIFYSKWGTIWDFVVNKTIFALVIVGAIIVLIVVLSLLGVGH